MSQALIAAAREMGAKLVQSAYSTIVREANDASATLLDRDGNIVALAELIPMHLASMASTFAPCVAHHPVAELRPGDFYVTNHPYEGGQHIPDVFIFSPIFVDGEVVGFSGTIAHHLDMGGGRPGLNAGASDLFQEGLVIPPSRFNFDRDWNGGVFERLIAANVRVPDLTLGDFNAQFAANAIGGRRVQELCARYGKGKVLKVMAELMDYSERRVRAAIAALPDGEYVGEDALDDDGLCDKPLPIRASVTIQGDRLAIDFSGSNPQVERNLNSPLASTTSAALACVKTVLTDPDIPFNGGSLRPVSVSAPLGSILNPRPPAPVRARMEAGYRVFNAVMKALAQVAPERVIACGFDTTTTVALSHSAAGRGWKIFIDVLGGGYGAAHDQDGCDAVDSPLSNCSNTPVEVLDLEYPYFRLIETGLLPDSAGAGRHRGGLGFFRRYRILEDGVGLAIYSDRFRLAPEGLFGGAPGSTGRCWVLRGDEEIDVGAKDEFVLQREDILTVAVGGGAGYGDPSERDPAAIARDVAEGYVSGSNSAR